MHLLNNAIQTYAWGSPTAFDELLGIENPSREPRAELWMGAHPSAPSRIAADPAAATLLDLIEADPDLALGPRARSAFGDRLPFLLKVLAAETPLSLQAHPSAAQAQAGFAAEEAAGIPRNAAKRSYRDRSHKPELLCALTRFEALCGFRELDATLRLFDALDVPELEPRLRPLRKTTDRAALERVVGGLLADRTRAADLAESVAAACRRAAASGGAWAEEARWGARIGELYPGDVGVVVALFSNLVVLEPGEAIFLPAGNLHAYLHGTGVEIMANSDNVLRAGLTPKHVDVAELLRVLDFRVGPAASIQPRPRPNGARFELVYFTPATEFELSRLDLDAASFRSGARRGPEILLCVEGDVTCRSRSNELRLRRGQSAAVFAAEGEYVVTGSGRLFRAQIGVLS